MAKRATRQKPKDPQAIMAEKRARAFAEVGLQPSAAFLSSNDDVMVELAERPGQGKRGHENRVRRLSGLDWLWQKERLQPYQMEAGLRYGDDYRKANDISVRSHLAEARGGDPDSAQHKRMEAFDRVKGAHSYGLMGHQQMIDLCNSVAGEGTRLTVIAKGDDVLTRQLEAVFIVALDLLAIHYGMMKR